MRPEAPKRCGEVAEAGQHLERDGFGSDGREDAPGYGRGLAPEHSPALWISNCLDVPCRRKSIRTDGVV